MKKTFVKKSEYVTFVVKREMKEQMKQFSEVTRWSQSEQIRSGLELLWRTHPVFQDAEKYLREKR